MVCPDPHGAFLGASFEPFLSSSACPEWFLELSSPHSGSRKLCSGLWTDAWAPFSFLKFCLDSVELHGARGGFFSIGSQTGVSGFMGLLRACFSLSDLLWTSRRKLWASWISEMICSHSALNTWFPIDVEIDVLIWCLQFLPQNDFFFFVKLSQMISFIDISHRSIASMSLFDLSKIALCLHLSFQLIYQCCFLIWSLSIWSHYRLFLFVLSLSLLPFYFPVALLMIDYLFPFHKWIDTWGLVGASFAPSWKVSLIHLARWHPTLIFDLGSETIYCFFSFHVITFFAEIVLFQIDSLSLFVSLSLSLSLSLFFLSPFELAPSDIRD